MVKSMLPCENCWETEARRTPLPVAFADTPNGETANSSANSAREPLKPVVLVLAMLFAVTCNSADAALIPLSASLNGMGKSPLG